MIDFKKLFGKKAGSTVENVVGGVSNLNPLEGMSTVERQGIDETLEKFAYYLTSVLIFLSPIFILPIINDWFDLPRAALVSIVGLVGASLVLLRLTLTRRFTLTSTAFDLAILLMIASSLISAFLSRNRFYALSIDPALYLGAGLLFFLIVQAVRKPAQLESLVKLPLFAASLVSLWTVLQVAYLLVAPTLKLNLNFAPLFPTFSLAGSPLAQALLLLSLLPVAVGLRLSQTSKAAVSTFSLFIGAIAAGLVATSFLLFRNPPITLPQSAGWRIATVTLGESVQTAFFGTGPGNFVDAFTAYKPVEINNSPLWNLRFAASSNHYFYLLTTLGIAGLASFLLLVLRFVQVTRSRLSQSTSSNLEKGLIGGIAVTLLAILFVPAPYSAILLLLILLGLFAANLRLMESNHASIMENTLTQSPGLRTLFTLGVAVVALAVTYYLGRVLIADYFFARSLDAIRNNRGNEAYTNQIQAIRYNPWSSSLRVAYSNTNLALANSLAGQPNLTDAQRQAVVTLVQQSIREGRIAAALDNRRAGNWENLSLTYRSLINFAQGAEQWAVATQNQAINAEPLNPRLRLDLGGIYYALQNYQLAGQIFVQAVNLKPDYANAHYNLAQALRQLNQREQALVQLQLTASIVCSAQGQAAADCKRVNQEITALGSTPASPAAGLVQPGTETEIKPATPASQNLPNAQTQPPAVISSPSGELEP